MTNDIKPARKYLWQHTLFVFLLILVCAAIAAVSLRYSRQIDLSDTQRNTLSEESRKILGQMTQPLQFSIFASNNEELRRPIQDLIERYKHYKPDIQYSFIDPDLQPALVRESKVQINGEVILHYGSKSEHLRRPTESTYSNAMQRLMRDQSRWILFIHGHGEREPQRQANQDVSQWVTQLSQRGLQIQSYALAKSGVIPDNSAALVIAGPQVDYLNSEIEMLKKYLDDGGNLLWLVEPDGLHGLQPLADYLHIDAVPGIIMDQSGKTFGLKDPRFIVVADYPEHDITKDLAVYTVFPEARAINQKPDSPWQGVVLLKSSADSWIATNSDNVAVPVDSSQLASHSFGLVLTRQINTNPMAPEAEKKYKQQRIIVIGDGDFLSNTYLGNVGNLEFGFNMMNWLNQDDNFLRIPVNPAPDKQLLMDDTQLAALGVFFFIVLPLGFIIIAITLWYRHRNA